MKPWFLRLHATIGDRIVFEGEQPRGYYQRLGVTAGSEAELAATIQQYVLHDTGGQVLELDDFEVADLAGAHQDLADVCGDPSAPGVWYASGRGFYSDDGDDEEDDE